MSLSLAPKRLNLGDYSILISSAGLSELLSVEALQLKTIQYFRARREGRRRISARPKSSNPFYMRQRIKNGICGLYTKALDLTMRSLLLLRSLFESFSSFVEVDQVLWSLKDTEGTVTDDLQLARPAWRSSESRFYQFMLH
jgi:hypothetical protein